MILSFCKKENFIKTLIFIFFISVIICMPALKSKIIVGTLVNASLLLSVYFYDLKHSIFLCLIPSLVAVFSGIIPNFLFFFIPFVMISNIILVFLFDKLKKLNLLKATFIAIICKCLFLYLISWNVPIFYIISAHQVYTAFYGGSIAFLSIKYLQKA